METIKINNKKKTNKGIMWVFGLLFIGLFLVAITSSTSNSDIQELDFKFEGKSIMSTYLIDTDSLDNDSVYQEKVMKRIEKKFKKYNNRNKVIMVFTDNKEYVCNDYLIEEKVGLNIDTNVKLVAVKMPNNYTEIMRIENNDIKYKL